MKGLTLLSVLCVFAVLAASCGGGGGGGGGGTSAITSLAVSATSPASNATGIALTTAITVSFNMELEASSITDVTFIVRDGANNRVTGTVTCTGTTATFTPSSSLVNSSTYTVVVTTGVRSTAGNIMASDYTWSFVTAPPGTVSLAVSATTPASNATGVALTTAITATFNMAVEASSVTNMTFIVKDSANYPVQGSLTCTGSTVTFTPAMALANAAAYTIMVNTGVRGTEGNTMATNYSWNFTTTPIPMVVSTTPAANATGVAVNRIAYTTGADFPAPITITFSEAMDVSTIYSATVLVTDSINNPVAGTVGMVSYSGNKTASFTPENNLTYGVTYRVSVTTGIKDVAGNPLASNYTWSFTTVPALGSWIQTGTSGAPALSGHTAVWTGTEMIVFDGFSGAGAIYNPATDSWRPIVAPAGILPPRILHSVVWSGTEMIIWGGLFNLVGVNTGARYNPSSDTWLPMTVPPASIPARYLHTALWTGTEMLVWGGGSGSTGTTFNSGGRYNPVLDQWTPIATFGAPAARNSHVAVWTGSKMIVWGGFLITGGIYDPGSDSWLPTATNGAPSSGATVTGGAVWTGTEMIVWGGRNSNGRYNPATNSWKSISINGATPAGAGTLVWTDSLMLQWEGELGGRYDPSSDIWSAISANGAPSVRTGHSAVWSGTEMIIYGGQSRFNSTTLNTGGRYTP